MRFLADLALFVEVANTRNFSRAAAALMTEGKNQAADRRGGNALVSRNAVGKHETEKIGKIVFAIQS